MQNQRNYKLSHLRKDRILSAARKALIAADASYYAWPADRQEHFRATMNEKCRDRIQQQLLANLADIETTPENSSRVWNKLSPEKLNELNWASLLTSGVGDDFIYLNECMADEKSLLSFSTLYDYDHDDYLFQESANRKESPDYEGTDYYALKHPSWIRLLIHDQFHYGTLFSLATHVQDKLEEMGSSIIEELIPHTYTEGKDHGKPKGSGFVFNMEVDASGKEGQLDELKSRWYQYLYERWLELSRQFCEESPAVYMQDLDLDDDPHRVFVFRNEETLKRVRWRHFLTDCEKLAADFSGVDMVVAAEQDSASAFLSENHRDIMKNFDPSLLRFRKKRKIVLSEQALEDLAGFEPGG